MIPIVDDLDRLIRGFDIAEQIQITLADGARTDQRVQLMISSQKLRPNSKMGRRRIRPVCISVSVSNNSSSVPNPPGKTVIAAARIRKCILRMAK